MLRTFHRAPTFWSNTIEATRTSLGYTGCISRYDRLTALTRKDRDILLRSRKEK